MSNRSKEAGAKTPASFFQAVDENKKARRLARRALELCSSGEKHERASNADLLRFSFLSLR